MSNIKNTNINGLLDFMEDDTRAFSRMRNTLKASGDMFLFGEPSEKIAMVMMKLYHENLVRNLCYQDNTTSSPKMFADCPISQKLMCGIIQVGEELYVTLAETPVLPDGPVENAQFDLRETTLLALLSHCNINVRIAENAKRNKNLNSKIAWRHFHEGAPKSEILLEKGFDSVYDYGLFDEKNKTNYDAGLWSKPMEINFINSYNYLERRLKGESFSPFKKFKSNSKIIECNNGSTCVESKLFSYLFDNLDMKFEDIDGIAAFWLGNEISPGPGHILEKYCYSRTKKQELPKLERIVSILESKVAAKYIRHAKQYQSYNSTMLGVAEQFAMSCPGCYANYLNYKTGEYDEWNPVHCYERTDATNGRMKNREKMQANLKAKRKSRKRVGAGGTRRKSIRYREVPKF